ncbi:hemin uptake protein HemP [Rubellimicrobium sp. CFH 75288]|uniref:hemin uptake protein HemP n=1 Tax=Rubellimicrobium sp. CFH 75288 TaxID=2697034 RepID=UPI00141376A3|nr:hemin uptake protein HemP [Rubellimicrobium sp. CFH 75288]NAZ35728.1 hemin uptake protein HemP [Rubellimicrobium sp. CFH 75288]
MPDGTPLSPAPREPAPCPALPEWRAESLTGPDGRAVIRLGSQSYVLRITRAGKLILTK